ncbi:MAG: hypothetical protein WCD04_12075 [Terriglobia bacterium]
MIVRRTVTDAAPDFVVSCDDVAVIVTEVVFITVRPVTSAVSPVETTVAAAVLDDFQVTAGLKLPVPATVAAHCELAPLCIEVGLQAIVTEAMVVGVVTVTVGLVPVIDPDVAVNVTVPAATPVATPDAEIVATLALDELHVAEFVMFWALPSE